MSVVVIVVVIAVTVGVRVGHAIEMPVRVLVFGLRLRYAREYGGGFVTIGLHAIEPGGQLRKHGHAGSFAVRGEVSGARIPQ